MDGWIFIPGMDTCTVYTVQRDEYVYSSDENMCSWYRYVLPGLQYAERQVCIQMQATVYRFAEGCIDEQQGWKGGRMFTRN